MLSRIIALAALAMFVMRPAGGRASAVLGVGALLELAIGASQPSALGIVPPLVVFIAAALTLASLVERAGLADRAAAWLASRARGRTVRLYWYTCALCALLTSVVSLDGAVVLMVPILAALNRRWSVPVSPLFVGTVVVANVASLALPQGNPTNLVIMDRLGISAPDFTAHMFVPGAVAAMVVAAASAFRERRSLAGSYEWREPGHVPLSAPERRACAALFAAAAAAWAAPFLGMAPWWPFAGVVALGAAVARERPRVDVAARVGLQVGALVVLVDAVAIAPAAPAAPNLAVLLVVAAIVGAAAALANNLPVSVSTAGLLVGHAGYAAAIGLGAGSLALPRGSVATIIAVESAGPGAPRLTARALAPLAAVAVATATLLFWLGL